MAQRWHEPSPVRAGVRIFAGWFPLIFASAVWVLVAVAVASVVLDRPVDRLTGDVAAVFEIHPLSGLLSNLGILLWCVTAAVCLFSAMVLSGAVPSRTRNFLLASGLLSTFLLLDDLFLIHDDLVPRYAGGSEELVYVLLAAASGAWLLAFRRVILSTEYALLAVALALLSASVVMDIVLVGWMVQLGHWHHLIEDGAKWLGIVSWCTYFVGLCGGLVISRVEATTISPVA